MHPTLAGEERDLDRATGRGAVLRKVEDHALWRDVVFRVVRVVRVEDAVDPVLRTARRRARRCAVGALVERRDGRIRPGRRAGYRRDHQEGCRRDQRDEQPLEGTHLPHLRCLPSLLETRRPVLLPPRASSAMGLDLLLDPQGIPRCRESQSLVRVSEPMARSGLFTRTGALPLTRPGALHRGSLS